MRATQTVIVSPTSRERLSGARPALLLIAFAVLVVLAAALIPHSRYNDAPVGIRNRGADGAHALAQVLGDHGVAVREVSASEAATVGEDTTLVVIFPSRMHDSVARAVETRANVIYVGLEEDYGSSPYTGGLESTRNWVYSDDSSPQCSSEIAQRATSLAFSTYQVRGTSPGWQTCFPTPDGSYAYAERDEPGRFRALIPDSARLRNREILRRGNAALAINSIGRTPKVAWYSPTRADRIQASGQASVMSPYVAPAFLTVVSALMFAALARGRRLGPLTPEHLPVEVPAAETLVGKARLMRTHRTYEHAATALRSEAASRIAASLGVSTYADQETLAHAIEQRGLRASRSSKLLWGPAPSSERDLVRLIHDLDALEKEIRHD